MRVQESRENYLEAILMLQKSTAMSAPWTWPTI